MLKGDGIWTASMGLPNMGRIIGNIVMKKLVSAGSEARRLEKLIRKFQLKELTLLLLIRLGYSDPMPYSFRRNISNMILK